MNNHTNKSLAAFAVATLISMGLLHAQSHDHDHSGHNHDRADHDRSGHDHGPADQIGGDAITLTPREQQAMGLVMESIEMRPLAGGDEAVALPHGSIVDRGGKYFVFIQDESDATKFIQSEVTLGKGDDRYVDALTGVFPGDTVIARGAQKIGAPRDRDFREGERVFCPLDGRRPVCDYGSPRDRLVCPLGNDRFDSVPYRERDYRYYEDRREPEFRDRRERNDGFLNRLRSFRFR